MSTRSPLGKYSQIVAAVVALSIIGTYLVALVFGHLLGVDQSSLSALDKLAFLAAGAVFGAAAAVNGVKEPLESAHNRIDHIERASGIPTHGAYIEQPPNPPPAA